MAVQNFEQIVDKARAAGRSSRVVIAGADAENILLGAFHAAEEGFAYPVLVGEEAKIRPCWSGWAWTSGTLSWCPPSPGTT